MLSADLIRIRIAWIAYTRPHNGLHRGWVRGGDRDETTFLVHVYRGSPPRNMIYSGGEARGVAAGYGGFQKYRRLRQKVTSRGLAECEGQQGT